MDQLLTMLRAAADPTRLRLLVLLREGELTVTELTQIMGQSQPRISRHLKLLCEAGLLHRFKEGSWVFYRSADRAQFINQLLALPKRDPAAFEADRRRLDDIREARAAAAAAFFKANAAEWERIRSLHAPEQEVENTIQRLIASAPVDLLLDAGTGTGRMLELLAPQIGQGVGIDISPEMLAIARDRLERARAYHCQVRLADICRLPFPPGSGEGGFDVALFHQVLHYLADPEAAVLEAVRVLRPGGRVVIVDFAPHKLEFCRTELAHRRLGFADREVGGWFEAAGARSVASEAIAPHSGAQDANKLTVKVWVGTSPGAPRLARNREAA